jgi:hypothetical protein
MRVWKESKRQFLSVKRQNQSVYRQKYLVFLTLLRQSIVGEATKNGENNDGKQSERRADY